MATVQSFAPIANSDARVLILGSMPGVPSLIAQEYYANPRNSFWKIVFELLEIEPSEDYATRADLIRSNGIALWDVIRSCEREGSLDSKIIQTSIIPNDFATFFLSHSRIERVFFNGMEAEKSFKRHVWAEFGQAHSHLACERLPSTSPANARTPYCEKLTHWRAILS